GTQRDPMSVAEQERRTSRYGGQSLAANLEASSGPGGDNPMWSRMRTPMLGAALIAVSIIASSSAALAMPYGSQGIFVSTLDNAHSDLVGKLVVDRSGRPIGRVHSVDRDREGKAGVVNIEVGAVRNRGTQIVSVDAHQIVYYPQKGTLVASLDPPPVQAPA